MSLRKLAIALLPKTTDCIPKEHRYDAWKLGCVEKNVGPGAEHFSKALYTELVKYQVPVDQIHTSTTPICRKIQNTKKILYEYFPKLESRYDYWLWPRVYNSWGNITKISDAFVRGMGTFDFVSVTKELDSWYTASLARVRATGYFGTSGGWRVEKLFSRKSILDWTIQYWSVLKRHPHIDGIMQHIEERQRLGMKIDQHPDKLAVDYGNVKFDWLANVQIPGFTVPTRADELEKAGVHFRNCAGSYVGSVARKRCLVFWNNDGMAEYVYKRGIVQCVGFDNQTIDKTPFEAVIPTLEKLWETKR